MVLVLKIVFSALSLRFFFQKISENFWIKKKLEYDGVFFSENLFKSLLYTKMGRGGKYRLGVNELALLQGVMAWEWLLLWSLLRCVINFLGLWVWNYYLKKDFRNNQRNFHHKIAELFVASCRFLQFVANCRLSEFFVIECLKMFWFLGRLYMFEFIKIFWKL